MYSEIAANKRKTVYIMIVFFAFVAAIAWLFGKMIADTPYVTYGAIVGSFLYAIFCYFSGSSMALAVNGAHEIKKDDSPRLWRTVENLGITDGLPMPRVFIMSDPAPN